MYLRQSTASQEILLGTFVDDTDGKTAETALTIANTDIRVWKHGGTTEASKNSGGATHIASGRYYAVLDATDTDTLGNLEINVHVSGALPIRREFVVLSANVYDTMFGTFTLTEPSSVTAFGTVNPLQALAMLYLQMIGQDSVVRSSSTAGTLTQKTVAGVNVFTRALTDNGTTASRGAGT